MKTKTFLLLALFVAMTYGAFAVVITVSNNPNSPGQYTSLQTAIDAAGITGDTLMVAGSTTNYGSITISKKIVLVGAGYNNPYGSNSSVTSINLNRSNAYVGASGTKIMGFVVTGTITLEPSAGGGTPIMNDVLIERCWLESVNFSAWYNSNSLSNDTVRNCVINGTITLQVGPSNYSAQLNNIHIHNNIFNGAYFNSSGYSLSTVFVRNNIFINRANNPVFNSVTNMVIENNIFYGAFPTVGSGCAFTKNIGYLCPDMPGAGNIGAGNMNNTNPQFVNFPLLGGAFSWSYNFHLQAGSPGIGAGTDGTDIGIYGGMLPFEVGANPHFPQMMTLTLPAGSSVPAGGTLNVHFTAKKQN
ncbi:MAG: hypothetical protein NT004_07630 [Bacteroidetes bacterium]|nr:hypothetical protein [Bacteroidota bacterium]